MKLWPAALGAYAVLTIGAAPASAKDPAPPAGGQTMVVVNKLGDHVAFLSLPDHRRLARIDLPAHPHECRLAKDGRTVFVSVYGDGIFGNNIHPGHQVFVIDAVERKVKGTLDTTPFRGPHGLALEPNGNVWVTCDRSGMVLVFDPATGKQLANIPTQSQGSHWVVMTPDGKKAYTANKFEPFLSVFDVPNRKMVGTITLPFGSEGLVVSPDGKTLVVCDRHENVLHIIDTATDKTLTRARIDGLPALPPGADPEGRVAFTPDGKWLVASYHGVDRAVQIDPKDWSVAKTYRAGKGPMGMGFNPREPGRVYLTNHDAGTVSVIDLDKKLIVDTFATSAEPVAGPETIVFVDNPAAGAAAGGTGSGR